MTESEQQQWQRATRILCVRLDALGDLLMTGPAMRALKEQNPNRHLTLLTSPAGAQAATLMPWIDETIVYRAPWMKATAGKPDPVDDLEMARRLEASDFEAAVIFTVYSQSPLPAALLLHLARVPLTLAYSRENPYHLLSNWIHEEEPQETVRHEVKRHLDLVARVGTRVREESLKAVPNADAIGHVDRLLERLQLDSRRDWLVVHPGASAPSRRYSPEQYARVLHELATTHGLTPVLTGKSEERPLVDQIRRASECGAIDLSGLLDLHQLTALLGRAPLLLSNNTGPVHLAAAMGTPVVVLYALTNPQHTPWAVPSRVLYHDVPCRFCYRSQCPMEHHDCLRLVEPERVTRSVLDLLAQTSGGSSETPCYEPETAAVSSR